LIGLAVTALAGPGERPPADLTERLRGMPPEEQLRYLRSLDASGRELAPVYFQMGNAHYTLGQLDSAVVFYGRATGVDSSYTKAWVNMGIAYDGQGQAAAARAAYERAIEYNPEDVLAISHLGFNHFQRGDVPKAMALYRQALAIDPDCAQAHYNLGLAFAEARVFGEALAEWRRVIELDPDGELGRVARENVGLIETYTELE
jgi:superkiller protein 3